MPETKPQPRPVEANDETPISIAKPGDFSLDKFKSKRSPTTAGVETLLTALPHHNMAQAKDWVRLHPDEGEYWSPEFCFVHVPIKGQKRDTLHLIDEELAMRHLPSGRIQRFRLALATKPLRRLLPLPRAVAEFGQQVERHQLAGLLAGQEPSGPRRPAAREKASRTTRSATPRIRIHFPSRIGQRRRSTS